MASGSNINIEDANEEITQRCKWRKWQSYVVYQSNVLFSCMIRFGHLKSSSTWTLQSVHAFSEGVNYCSQASPDTSLLASKLFILNMVLSKQVGEFPDLSNELNSIYLRNKEGKFRYSLPCHTRKLTSTEANGWRGTSCSHSSWYLQMIWFMLLVFNLLKHGP